MARANEFLSRRAPIRQQPFLNSRRTGFGILRQIVLSVTMLSTVQRALQGLGAAVITPPALSIVDDVCFDSAAAE